MLLNPVLNFTKNKLELYKLTVATLVLHLTAEYRVRWLAVFRRR